MAASPERALLLTEFTTDGTLRDLLAAKGHTLTLPERLSLARDVADGMAFAASRTVVHGCLRAASVLMVAGSVRITHFGNASAVNEAAAAECLR